MYTSTRGCVCVSECFFFHRCYCLAIINFSCIFLFFIFVSSRFIVFNTSSFPSSPWLRRILRTVTCLAANEPSRSVLPSYLPTRPSPPPTSAAACVTQAVSATATDDCPPPPTDAVSRPNTVAYRNRFCRLPECANRLRPRVVNGRGTCHGVNVGEFSSLSALPERSEARES